MRTKTRDLPTTAIPAITSVLGDLGSRVVEAETTPGACGYTRLTYTAPSQGEEG